MQFYLLFTPLVIAYCYKFFLGTGASLLAIIVTIVMDRSFGLALNVPLLVMFWRRHRVGLRAIPLGADRAVRLIT